MTQPILFPNARSMLCSLIFATAIASAWESARAEERFSLLHSSRSLGRGGTYVAAYDSDEATRGNVATMSEAKDITFQMRWLQFDGFIGENTVDTTSELSSLAGSSSSGLTFLKKFQEKFGKRQYVRLQLSPLAMRIFRFEFAPFVMNESFADLNIPTTPEFGWTVDSIAGVNLGYAHPITPTISLGTTLRPLYRWYFAGDLDVSNVADFMGSTDVNLDNYVSLVSGFGLGGDLGAIWTPSDTFRTGLVVRNIGDTSYFQDYGTEPPPIKQRISLGTLYRLAIDRWNLDLSADLQDILNRDDVGYFRLLHLGAEFGTSYFTRDNDAGIICGLNEGYFVGGGYVDVWLLRVDIVNYAVELGQHAGQKMDRRWALSLKATSTF